MEGVQILGWKTERQACNAGGVPDARCRKGTKVGFLLGAGVKNVDEEFVIDMAVMP
jgi:hypothetical protein